MILHKIRFAPGRTEIPKAAEATLAAVAATLLAHPQLVCVVIGHEAPGKKALAISAARAQNVAAALVALGVPP